MSRAFQSCSPVRSSLSLARRIVRCVRSSSERSDAPSSSTSGRPVIAANAALTRSRRPSRPTTAIPMGACSKALRKLSSASLSLVSVVCCSVWSITTKQISPCSPPIGAADGRVVPVSLSAAPIGGEQGEICLVVMDQTEQHTTETKLRLAEESSRSAFEQAPIGMAVVGLDGRLERVNAAFAAITGRPEVELLGASFLSLLDRTHRTILPAKLKELRTGEHDWKAREIRYQDAAGRGVWVSESAALVRDPDGRPHHILLPVEDITAEHEAQEALDFHVIHGPLTGLHNRAWILDILAVDLRAAIRLGHPVGALFVDLDNFKVVNDSLGHAAGDEVLATVADRIVAALRPEDRVGRFGGDEFVIVLQDVQDILELSLIHISEPTR